MPRTRAATRLIVWTPFLACGFALILQPDARGQQDPPWPPKKPDAAIPVMTKYKDRLRGGIKAPEELKEVRQAFSQYAKYYGEIIAHPAVYKASQDLIKVDPNMKTIDTGDNGILREIDRFTLVPVPGGVRASIDIGGNAEPGDYIREMGAAFDVVLKNLIENHQERIVRINAARVLAHVARTGAIAYWKTVTALIADPKTATEIKYYMLHAAAALLSTVPADDMKMRKHGADAATVAALVRAIDDCINKPELILPGFKPGTPGSDDQLPVIGMVRRQAVRALAQVKFARLPNPGGQTPYLYPAYTLVRVAMSDPALNPPPSPGECAEAVIGICRMAPVEWDNTGNTAVLIKEKYNADLAVEAVIQGLVTFAAPKVVNPNDNSLPWRQYALRIADAIMNWRPLFDPDAAFPQPGKFNDKLVPPSVEEMAKFVIPKVLAPMEQGGGARIDVPELRARLAALQQNPNRKALLFEGVKETAVPLPKK
jgi:hypothetical protein